MDVEAPLDTSPSVARLRGKRQGPNERHGKTPSMKVAIIHYWLVGMRGGEKVVETLCDMYPQADIFTHVYVPEMVSEKIRQHRIIPTFINALPRAAKDVQELLAVDAYSPSNSWICAAMTSSSAVNPDRPRVSSRRRMPLHVCYCHTPMRYIWNMYHEYRGSAGRFTRLMMPAALSLSAHVGRNFCRARRQLCCEFDNSCGSDPSLLRQRIPS